MSNNLLPRLMSLTVRLPISLPWYIVRRDQTRISITSSCAWHVNADRYIVITRRNLAKPQPRETYLVNVRSPSIPICVPSKGIDMEYNPPKRVRYSGRSLRLLRLCLAGVLLNHLLPVSYSPHCHYTNTLSSPTPSPSSLNLPFPTTANGHLQLLPLLQGVWSPSLPLHRLKGPLPSECQTSASFQLSVHTLASLCSLENAHRETAKTTRDVSVLDCCRLLSMPLRGLDDPRGQLDVGLP